jgi:hypothetical protein
LQSIFNTFRVATKSLSKSLCYSRYAMAIGTKFLCRSRNQYLFHFPISWASCLRELKNYLIYCWSKWLNQIIGKSKSISPIMMEDT